MSKYDPLGRFLTRNRQPEISLTFREIEALLGFPLPPRAQHIRAWWSNNADNNVMTKVWLEVGYKTERVDMASGRLVFKRVRAVPAADASGTKEDAGTSDLTPRRHPGFGLVKGVTTIAPGTDLTAPTGGDWGRSE